MNIRCRYARSRHRFADFVVLKAQGKVLSNYKTVSSRPKVSSPIDLDVVTEERGIRAF